MDGLGTIKMEKKQLGEIEDSSVTIVDPSNIWKKVMVLHHLKVQNFPNAP